MLTVPASYQALKYEMTSLTNCFWLIISAIELLLIFSTASNRYDMDRQCNQLLACNFNNTTNCDNLTICRPKTLASQCPCQNVKCFMFRQLCGYACEKALLRNFENCLSCLRDGDEKNCISNCTGICLTEACRNFTELCHNSTDCPPGYFGETCSQVCSPACHGSCDKITGFCENCTGTSYGPTCDLNCSKNCLNNVCLEKNGSCIECSLGYHGDMCNETCPTGYYGLRCRNQCPDNCKQNVCNVSKGECLQGCNRGYYGRLCEKPCPDQFYGFDCVSQCPVTCAEGSTCDHVNGSCSSGCAAGFWGDHCDKVCSNDKHGPNCESNCSKNCFFDVCNPFSGYCTQCKTGREGLFCELAQKHQVLGPFTMEAELSSDEIFLIFASMICMGAFLWFLLGASMYYRRKVQWQKMQDKGQLPKVASIIPPVTGRYPFLPKRQTQGTGIWRQRGSKRHRRFTMNERRRPHRGKKLLKGFENFSVSPDFQTERTFAERKKLLSIPQHLLTEGYLSRSSFERQRRKSAIAKKRLTIEHISKEDEENMMSSQSRKSLSQIGTEKEKDIQSREEKQAPLVKTLSYEVLDKEKPTASDTLSSLVHEKPEKETGFLAKLASGSTDVYPETESMYQSVKGNTTLPSTPMSLDLKAHTEKENYHKETLTYTAQGLDQNQVIDNHEDTKRPQPPEVPPVPMIDSQNKEISDTRMFPHQKPRMFKTFDKITHKTESDITTSPQDQPGFDSDAWNIPYHDSKTLSSRKKIKPKLLKATSRVKSLQKSSFTTEESSSSYISKPSKSTTTSSSVETSTAAPSKDEEDEDVTSTTSTIKTATSTWSATSESTSSSGSSTVLDRSLTSPSILLSHSHMSSIDRPNKPVGSKKRSKPSEVEHSVSVKSGNDIPLKQQGFFQRGYTNLANVINRMVQTREKTRPPRRPTVIVRDPPTPPPRPGSVQFFINRLETWRRAGGFQPENDEGVFEVIERRGSWRNPPEETNIAQRTPKDAILFSSELSQESRTPGRTDTKSSWTGTSKASYATTETARTSSLTSRPTRTSSDVTDSKKSSNETETMGTSSYAETTGSRSSPTESKETSTLSSTMRTTSLSSELSGIKTSSLLTDVSGAKTSSQPTELSGTSSLTTGSTATRSVTKSARASSSTTKSRDKGSSTSKSTGTSSSTKETSWLLSSSTVRFASTKSSSSADKGRNIKTAHISSEVPATLTTLSETMTSGQNLSSKKTRTFQKLPAKRTASSKQSHTHQKIYSDTMELTKIASEDDVRPQSVITKSEIPSAKSVKDIQLWGPDSTAYFKGQPFKPLPLAESSKTEESTTLSRSKSSRHSSIPSSIPSSSLK